MARRYSLFWQLSPTASLSGKRNVDRMDNRSDGLNDGSLPVLVDIHDIDLGSELWGVLNTAEMAGFV